MGEIDPGARLMDCDQAVPPNWICVFTSFDGDAASFRWVPGFEAQKVQEIDTGLNPLDVLVKADGLYLSYAVTTYGANTITVGTADGDNGVSLSNETLALPDGLVQPSSLHLTPDGLLVLGRDGSDTRKSVIGQLRHPW